MTSNTRVQPGRQNIVSSVSIFCCYLITSFLLGIARGDDTLPIQHITSASPGTVELSWQPAPIFLQLEQNFDLSVQNGWQAVQAPPTYQAPWLQLQLQITNPSQFYRLRVVAEPTAVFIPDPVTLAPELSPSSVTDFASQTQFLYTGATAIQLGVTPGTMTASATAVVRGLVKKANGDPLGGVYVAIHGRPEFGWTYTRADGSFDIALNGGELEHLDFRLSGYLPAQREVQVVQQNFARVDDVVMMQVDPIATQITFGANAPVQVANSSVRSDADGTRSATVFFPAGIGAQLLFSDGSTQSECKILAAPNASVDHLTIRATEYTVGPNGRAAMPAALPGTSAYTYCVELSADEAINAGAKSVLFDKSVAVYLDNFLAMPVGAFVPIGHYDRDKSAWVPDENGVVMKVVSVSNGVANLDWNGDGAAESDDALTAGGISMAERQQIASRFAVGSSFWRAPLNHFSSIDCNDPFLNIIDQPIGTNLKPPDLPKDCNCGFGELGIGSQVFKETVSLAGTSFALHYASDRVPGYLVNATVEVPLTGERTPNLILQAQLIVEIAGRFSLEAFAPQPNLVGTFQWNGRDIYHPGGSPIGGSAEAHIKVQYIYPSRLAIPITLLNNPQEFPPFFGLPGRLNSGISRLDSGGESIPTRVSRVLSVPDHRRVGLGAWSLTPHHFYDPIAKVLYRGNGSQVKIDTQGQGIGYLYLGSPTGLDGNGTIAVGAKGDVYFTNQQQIFKVNPQGQLIAVTNAPFTAGKLQIDVDSQDLDGKLAADVILGEGQHSSPSRIGPNPNSLQGPTPEEVRSGPDGSIYIAYSSAIWRLDRDDRFHLVLCGSDASQFGVSAPDGTSACSAYRRNDGTNRIAIAKDGSVYFTEVRRNPTLNLIRKIAPDGRIYTIAGLGGVPQDPGNPDIGTPALNAHLRLPQSLAVAPDDSVYYASGDFGIIRIKPDGILEVVLNGAIQSSAGRAEGSPSDEGQVAATAGTNAVGNWQSLLNFSDDGTLYFRSFYTGPDIIWKIGADGLLQRVGGGAFTNGVQTGSPLQIDLQHAISGLAFGPDRSLFVANLFSPSSSGIRRIRPALPGFSGNELTIASEDGSELYVFDQSGRHLRTIDPLLGYTKWTFGYNTRGFLASVLDRDGLFTQIERDGAGNPTGIVGPYGTRTLLSVDGNGYLARVTAPDQTQTNITNSADGLLQSITGPRQDTYSLTYDNLGRLTRGDLPTGGHTDLSRTGTLLYGTVTATTAGGRTETRSIGQTSIAGTQITRTYSGQAPTTETRRPDGSIIFDSPVSMKQIYQSPDPRSSLAGQASYPSLIRLITPGGPTAEITSSEQATPDPANPLSPLNFVNTTSINGNAWRNSYAADARTFTIQSPEARQVLLSVDAMGRPTSSKRGNLAARTFSYDNLGRLTATSRGSGTTARTTTISYDTKGFNNFVHAADGRETHITNDIFGQRLAIQLPGNRNVALTYGVDGQLESVTPPDRPAYTFQFDPSTGRTTYQAPVLTGVDNTTIIDQNVDQQLSAVTLPGGRHLSFAYTAASGKLSSMTDTYGDTFSYSYNSVGQLTKISQATDTFLALTYTGPVLSGVNWSGTIIGSVARQVNTGFRISTEAVNGETPIPYGYSADGLMTSAGALTLAWRSDVSLPASATVGGVGSSYTQNEFGELVHTASTFNGSSLLDVNDTLDLGGRVANETISIGGGAPVTTVYGYDAAGFLASVTQNETLVSSYTYDSNGNVTSAVTPDGTVSYTYDAQDRMLTAGGITFSYTDAGELKTRVDANGTTTYTYDEFGQLRKVSLPDGRLVEYSLGTPDMRIAKSVNGAKVQGLLRDANGTILAELDSGNAVVSRFVYSALSGTPAYLVRGSNTFRILTDALGSVRLVVDAQSGMIAQRLDYDEWGRVTLDTAPGFQPFGFAGGLFDRDTGLVRLGSRDYDPTIGRWTAPDPVKFAGGSTNLYAYVSNDPINSIDPSGTGPAERAERAKLLAEHLALYEENIKEGHELEEMYMRRVKIAGGVAGALGGGLAMSGAAVTMQAALEAGSVAKGLFQALVFTNGGVAVAANTANALAQTFDPKAATAPTSIPEVIAPGSKAAALMNGLMMGGVLACDVGEAVEVVKGGKPLIDAFAPAALAAEATVHFTNENLGD